MICCTRGLCSSPESMENPEQATYKILGWHYEVNLVIREGGLETVTCQNMLS